MKLFQQLLVAPAVLGLLASGAHAAELNINGVSDYAANASGNSLEQVTSVTQSSPLLRTTWLTPVRPMTATPTRVAS